MSVLIPMFSLVNGHCHGLVDHRNDTYTLTEVRIGILSGKSLFGISLDIISNVQAFTHFSFISQHCKREGEGQAC